MVEYFQIHVASSDWERPRLDEVNIALISNEENHDLIAMFLFE